MGNFFAVGNFVLFPLLKSSIHVAHTSFSIFNEMMKYELIQNQSTRWQC